MAAVRVNSLNFVYLSASEVRPNTTAEIHSYKGCPRLTCANVPNFATFLLDFAIFRPDCDNLKKLGLSPTAPCQIANRVMVILSFSLILNFIHNISEYRLCRDIPGCILGWSW